MFARLNNHEASVLYCGPSNKSVDVVLGMLTNLTIIKFISLTLLLGRYEDFISLNGHHGISA